MVAKVGTEISSFEKWDGVRSESETKSESESE